MRRDRRLPDVVRTSVRELAHLREHDDLQDDVQRRCGLRGGNVLQRQRVHGGSSAWRLVRPRHAVLECSLRRWNVLHVVNLWHRHLRNTDGDVRDAKRTGVQRGRRVRERHMRETAGPIVGRLLRDGVLGNLHGL